ncbi:recombinase family protein [Microbacterium caowuchunii]|uniref:Recombinase family protein n=1 Tax=Microbacterium caowuchunii TaxID=2614638 RepID=A0A5N0TGX7_9MICO|nr:recombinase family protein [Microbacterium caowuchunii]KAA9133724.1 recombinase family protein [Microbacterium caowuchunii]
MTGRLSRLPVRAGNRAIIYTRQSTYREESISLEVQEQAAREHCARNGYTVVGIESDPGVSGRSWKQRRGVQAALGAVEAGEADLIVVWRWSRLSRSRRDWAVAADRADLAGGRIESATEPNDQTAAGRFARGVMTELAAFESERIGEQWEEARQHRVARGLPSTGGTRFGYRIEEGSYRPAPETAPLLGEMYRLYLAGAGSAQICRMLNDSGVKRGRTGRPWHYQDVYQVMDTGFAAGLLVRTPPRPKDRPTASAPRQPVWEREFRPGIHEPVIDRATWDAYVAARQQRTTVRVRRGAPMLSGLIRCTDCGSTFTHTSWKAGRLYVCASGSRTDVVRQVSVAAHRIEAAVTEWVLGYAADLSRVAEAMASTEERAERVDMTARRAQQQLDRSDDRLTQLTLRLADGTITEAAYRLAAAAIEAEAAAARARLTAATRNPVRESAPQALPRDLARLWPGMTTEMQNSILRPLIDRIEVWPAAHRGDRSERWRIVPSWDA